MPATKKIVDAAVPSRTRAPGPIQPRFTASAKKKTMPSTVTTPRATANPCAPKTVAQSISRFGLGGGAGRAGRGGGARETHLRATGRYLFGDLREEPALSRVRELAPELLERRKAADSSCRVKREQRAVTAQLPKQCLDVLRRVVRVRRDPQAPVA